MPEFLKIIITATIVASLAFGISFLISLAKNARRKNRRPAAAEEPKPDPKIYYISETDKKRPSKKARKSPKPALKGIVLSPEQFKKIEITNKNGG